MDNRVAQVIGSLSGVYEVVLVQATDGTLAADVRPLVRLNVSVIMEKDGRREQGYAGGGGRGDYTLVTGNGRPLEIAAEAVRTAAVNMSAVPSPAGNMPVVLGSGWPGILLHEAIGHGLEGDFNRKGTSAFTGRIGERVATEQCTVVDDGTLVGRRGSLTVDDEGTPTSCNTLIERGVLKGYMFDKMNARLMGVKSTGNGRRESFAHTPMPRMTNTYMLPGKYDPEEIIASVDKGIYAPNFGGGQVDITSGKFVFSASEAYLIENGKKTVADQRRDADRQRPRGADARVDGRQRLEARRGARHVRQGRSIGAGRRRPADDPHRLADRRRHAGLIGRPARRERTRRLS